MERSILAMALLAGCATGPARVAREGAAIDTPRFVQHSVGAPARKQPDHGKAMTPELRFATGRYARRWVVTIGIDAYRFVPQLRVARSDARHIADRLTDQGFELVASLEDSGATRAGILELLRERLPRVLGPRDLVVVFFAGHGFSEGGTGYLVPYDGKVDAIETSVGMDELKDAVLRWPNRHTMFVVDACFSGAMFRREGAIEADNPLRYWEARHQDRLIEVLTAGDADELAAETTEWGVFTEAFDRGLSGAADANADGVVSGQELAAFASGEVAAKTQERQHPQWGTLEGGGTVLFWDQRRVPRNSPRVSRQLSVPQFEQELTVVHGALDRQEWQVAERLLRELMLRQATAALNLILAELYLAQDPLANGLLAADELRLAEQLGLDAVERRVLLELRARLERARRGVF